jgi:hypothetical protein
MNAHEEQFALTFIMPEKRDRYLSMLDSKRGRKKLRDGLYHCRDLDLRFAHLVPTGKQSSDSIERALKAKGAPDKCYLFSADDKFDGREMQLSEALLWIVGSNSGTFISCIAGKLGYFEFEDMSERYILEK